MKRIVIVLVVLVACGQRDDKPPSPSPKIGGNSTVTLHATF